MKILSCSSLAALLLVVPSLMSAADPAKAPAEPVIAWHDVTEWGLEGRAWLDEERLSYFDRLPAAAEKTVTPAVWGLSRKSAGLMVRFKTDADAIWVHYKVTSPSLAMTNMTAIGVSGIDLYARDEDNGGAWRWVQVAKPNKQEMKVSVVSGLKPGLREYAAYLPLYNGVEFLKIGVPEGAQFEGLAPRAEKPLVFYGTSITHGASASRPGMVHTAILGRRLDRPVVNLGFSGNGKMDAAVGDLLGRLEAAVFVIDCLPNMNADLVSERCVPLVKQIRAAHPDTPIVLVEDRRYANVWITPAKDAFHDANHAALTAAFETLKADGVTGLSYISGDHLYGDDTEGATDGSHASDLGFMRQADIFEPVLRAVLGE